MNPGKLAVLLGVIMVSAVQGQAPPEIERSVDTLVLCPASFQPALRDWLNFRQRQGHRFVVQAPGRTSVQVQQQIRRAVEQYPLANVVLIGDAVADRSQNPADTLPTDYRIAKVNAQYGAEPDIATDMTYADIDADGYQELNIGRIPADSAAELKAYLDKVIRYEQSSDFGTWRRRIELVAGVGNFDPLVDSVIEQTARRMVTDLVPDWYEVNVTIANWRSPFCPDPQQIDTVIVDRLNQGCLFWVYLGHSSPDELAPMQAGWQRFPVFGTQSAEQIHCRQGNPIGFFFSCYTGAFDAPEDCLAERLLRNPDGPVACVCGTRMTMPYGLATFSHELLRATGDGQFRHLGELITRCKQRLCQSTTAAAAGSAADGAAERGAGEDGGAVDQPEDYRSMIETLARTLSPTANLLDLERFEHAQMIHLMGDPLLRIAQPDRLQLDLSTDEVSPGQSVEISGIAEAPGDLTLELCYNRDRLRNRPPRRQTLDLSQTARGDYAQTYSDSNNMVCTRSVVAVEQGSFSTKLVIPWDANGACHIRAYLQTETQSWAQAAPLLLK